MLCWIIVVSVVGSKCLRNGPAVAKCGQWRLATSCVLFRRRRRQRVASEDRSGRDAVTSKIWACPSSLFPTLLPAIPPSLRLSPSLYSSPSPPFRFSHLIEASWGSGGVLWAPPKNFSYKSQGIHQNLPQHEFSGHPDNHNTHSGCDDRPRPMAFFQISAVIVLSDLVDPAAAGPDTGWEDVSTHDWVVERHVDVASVCLVSTATVTVCKTFVGELVVVATKPVRCVFLWLLGLLKSEPDDLGRWTFDLPDFADYLAVILTFDLSTSKSNQFVPVPSCT